MILKCAFDGHEFERTGRGRPPKFCDLHKPKDDSVKITSHSAQNPAEKSKSVFDLVPGLQELVQESNTRTLRCEFGEGHDWQAPRQRGRLPRFCPEHVESFSKPISTATPTQRSSDQVKEIRSKYPSCTCDFDEMSTSAEIRAIVESCTSPNFICSCLDSVRRTLNL
jgi:hypothetical protein